MARCTAPVRGHRSASAAAACPACRGRSSGYRSYSSPRLLLHAGERSHQSQQFRQQQCEAEVVTTRFLRGLHACRGAGTNRRSAAGSRNRAPLPDLRDVFLCHAWDDRGGAAKELHDLLEARGVSVWFSEKDVVLGTSLLREIDKGLAKSRVGIVLGDPCTVAPPSTREHCRQRALGTPSA